jgi:molybdenum cofactor cytidylyltransferase
MSDALPRYFAIVPAAGLSVRMGRPKLLLPWRRKTVIETVLEAWRASGVSHVVMTVRPEDIELAALGRASGAETVVVSPPPPDMKASVLAGLDYVARNYQPRPTDAWLLAPADMPLLSAQVIDALLAARGAGGPSDEIVAPCRSGKRGHPVLFPWPLAAAARRLGPDEGLNQLLTRHRVREIPVDDETGFIDLDTPDDYRRWKAEVEGE